MRSSHGIGAVTIRELERMGSRPLYAMVMLVLPLFSFALCWAIFCRGVPRDLPIVVCDLDHSALSRRIVRMLDASAGLAVVRQTVDPESAYRLIKEGRSYALVLLPKDLQREVAAHRAPKVVSYYNNELLLPGSLVNRDIRNILATISAGVDFRATQLRTGTARVAAGAVEPIHIDQHQLFNPYLNYAYFLATALLPTMLQIFILVSVVYGFGSELKAGSAPEWLAVAGGRPWKAVVGKFIPYSVVFGALSTAMLLFIFRFIGTPLRGNVALIGWASVLFVIDYELMALLIVTLAANLRLSLNLAAFFATTAFTFVGITFPAIGLPYLAKAWAAIIPLSYYLKILIDQAMRATPVAYNILPLTTLAAFVPLLLIVPILRFKKLMTQDRYWGRS